jgi:hypothetical protein
MFNKEINPELEPVRQSGSGPAGPDKTGRKVHPAGRNRIFAGVLSVCRQK